MEDNREIAFLMRVYGKYKYNANRRGIEFSLFMDDVRELIYSPCFYCGEIGTISFKDSVSGNIYKRNGIDRVDNDLGYFRGNVVSCCWTCNEKKKAMSGKAFLKWIRKVYNHTKDSIL